MPWGGYGRNRPTTSVLSTGIPLCFDSLHQIDSVASRFVDKHMPIG